MKTGWRWVLLVLLVGLSACPDPQLGNARQVWASQGLSNYSYRVQRSCFCPVAQPMILEIRSNTLASIVYADTQTPVPDGERPKQIRIEDYFDLIDSVRAKGGTVKAEYDATRGHPTTISSDPIPNAVDDETYYTISNLKPL